MRLFLTVMFTAAALLLQPVADQALGDFAFRPNLQLAPLAVCVSLCPSAAAVICCGFLGLILDCLAGPQLGARAACFCLLSALGSITVGRRADSWPGRVAAWGAILFAAEMLSRIIACSSLGGTFRPAAAAFDAALSAMATTIFLCGLWLAGQLLLRGPRSARSIRRLAPAIGRASSGD
jgi:cell shape-determining protein MreD